MVILNICENNARKSTKNNDDQPSKGNGGCNWEGEAVNTVHRICIWHMLQNAAEKLSHAHAMIVDGKKSFFNVFKKCVYEYEDANLPGIQRIKIWIRWYRMVKWHLRREQEMGYGVW